jgi:hypothetical protein
MKPAFLLRKFLAKFLNIGGERSKLPNCFNAVQFYWDDTENLAFTNPNDFASYLKENYDEVPADGDIEVIWSRDHRGIVIEHSFVNLDEQWVFHKADPSPESPYEIAPRDAVIFPYLNRHGLAITQYKRRHFPSPDLKQLP